MLKFKYAMLGLLFTINASAQIEIRPYEQIAIDYFANELIPHPYIKHFVFDGNLESELPSYYSCWSIERIGGYTGSTITKVNPPYPQIVEKLGFFRDLFSSKKVKGYLQVYKYYPEDDNNVVVVIYLSRKRYANTVYSFLIDKESKQVIDYCQKYVVNA